MGALRQTFCVCIISIVFLCFIVNILLSDQTIFYFVSGFLKNSDKNSANSSILWKLFIFFLRVPFIFFGYAIVILSFQYGFLSISGYLIYFLFGSGKKRCQKCNARKSVRKLCIRVASKGLSPEVLQSSVTENHRICQKFGIDHHIEIATECDLSDYRWPKTAKIVKSIVPDDYKTSQGAIAKARALHYCIENNFGHLEPDDWIIL